MSSNRVLHFVDPFSIGKKLAMLVQQDRHCRSPLHARATQRQTIIMPPPPPSPTEPVVERVNLATLPYSVRTGFSYGFLARRGDRGSLSCETLSGGFSAGPPMSAATERTPDYRRAPQVTQELRCSQTSQDVSTRQEKSSTASARAVYSASWRRRTDRACHHTSSCRRPDR